MAICVSLPLLFQIAVLSFASYKPKIPTTLSTKVVLPFAEGLGRKAKLPPPVSQGAEERRCAADHVSLVKAPFGIADF